MDGITDARAGRLDAVEGDGFQKYASLVERNSEMNK
jgi:hypothetical protein